MNKKAFKLNKSNNQGFTLIEVIIAVGIFAIGFLALGSMQINALNNTRNSRRVTEAMVLAEAQAEKLLSLPFYADDNNFDDDGDGTKDNYDVMPDLDSNMAPHSENGEWTGAYAITWAIIDDEPLAEYPQDIYIVGDTLTRSKTITVSVTPDNNTGNVLARLVVSKVWAGDL